MVSGWRPYGISVNGLRRRIEALEDIASPPRTVVVLCYLGRYRYDGKMLDEDCFGELCKTHPKSEKIVVARFSVSEPKHFPQQPSVPSQIGA